MNIRAINLTQALLQSSKSLFAKDGSLTWFKGDTHWNKQGIGVAAKVYVIMLRFLIAIHPRKVFLVKIISSY